MKKYIVGIIIGLILGCIITLLVVCFTKGTINSNVNYGILEWVYYITQPVLLVVTAAAVFVALFGNEIRATFYREHCKVDLVNSGFYENLGKQYNTPNPVAQSYDCVISLTNDGDLQIEKCEVLLKEVYYKSQKEESFKRIFSAEHKALYWKTPECKNITILQKDTWTLPLFKIYPEASCQTPDDTNKSKMQMKIIGCNIQEKYTKKGIWKTIYEVHSQSKVLSRFEITAEWSGVWCNRSTEMDEHVNANLNVLVK